MLKEIDLGPVWSGPSVSRGRVYVGTGNTLFSPADYEAFFPKKYTGVLYSFGLPGRTRSAGWVRGRNRSGTQHRVGLSRLSVRIVPRWPCANSFNPEPTATALRSECGGIRRSYGGGVGAADVWNAWTPSPLAPG